MTTTRLHSCDTTATSWEMKSAAASRDSVTFRSSRRICCCTVTSSAVVGSSAIVSRGSIISPMAMTARWRMPPENSWGYWRTRASGPAMRTERRRSTLRCRAWARGSPSWTSATSDSCRPTRRAGLSDDIGSW